MLWRRVLEQEPHTSKLYPITYSKVGCIECACDLFAVMCEGDSVAELDVGLLLPYMSQENKSDACVCNRLLQKKFSRPDKCLLVSVS